MQPNEASHEGNMDVAEPRLGSLAPVYSDMHHGLYLGVITRALNEQPEVRNIALAGTYGTGKSSILHRLHDAYPGRVIELSLLTLGARPEDLQPTGEMNPAAGTTTNRIQKEIVKQLLYQQRPTDAPESRFRRITRFRWGRELLLAVAVAAVGIAIAMLFGFSATTAPTVGVAFASREPWMPTVAAYLVLAILLGGVVLAVRSLIRGRAAIEKVNAGPATITLPPRSSSYFDEYLDEIIYFFEMNATIDIVVIEDLDRFNDPHIFEALRSLNGLLNAARQLDARNIRFIYAVRDSVFAKLGQDGEATTDDARAELARANRTKFFELIVPVVPFITHKNARDLMHQLLTERGHSISKDLISVAARHLADMRLVQNIVNEFEIFKNRLLDVPRAVPELDADQLFAMVTYKNAHMADFEAIRLGTSALDRLWDKWRELVEENIDRLERANAQRLQGIANHEAASRHAIQLGNRLRAAVDALHAAPGTGLASATVTHNGATVDDMALRSPEFWQRLVQSGTPLSLDAFRNGSWGSGPMSLSVAAVEALTGMRVAPDRFVADAVDAERTHVANDTQALAFLRRHSWKQLAARSQFSSGVLHGEDALFRDWIEALLPSKLAVDLVVNGYITQYFSLHVSAFYGQLIRPDAMVYVMKHVDAGSADAEYPLDAEDVEAILRDQGDAVLLERSMLNISILDYLLRTRSADAVTVLRNLPVFDEKGAFLQRYFAVGAEKRKLVELLTPLTPDIFVWLTVRAALDTAERLELVDLAARQRSAEVTYELPAELRELLEDNYASLPTLKKGTGPRDTQMVVDVIVRSHAVIADLSMLPPNAVAAFRGTRAYALTHANLVAVTGVEDVSLDTLSETDEAIFSYAIDEINTYLAIVHELPPTHFAVTSRTLFDSVLREAHDWESTQFAYLVQEAAPACIVANLSDYPVASWDPLVRFRRVPMTFANVKAYLDEHGQVTASLVASLEQAEVITDIEAAQREERVRVALSILNANVSAFTARSRVRLTVSLEPGGMDVTSISPLPGTMVGDLIQEELIADDAQAFSSRLMVDWETQAHAMRRSQAFPSLIGPTTLDTNFVREVFNADEFENLWAGLVAALPSYSAQMPRALAALADRVVAGQVSIQLADVEMARSKGLADTKVIELLAHLGDEVPFDQFVAMLKRLGGVWAMVSTRGRTPLYVTDTPGVEEVLTRLERGEIVSSKSRNGRSFRVNRKHPTR